MSRLLHVRVAARCLLALCTLGAVGLGRAAMAQAPAAEQENTGGNQVLHTEGLFQIKRADLAQGGDGFFVSIIACNDDDFVFEIGAMG